MIDELKKNINTEIEMLREISNYSQRLESATAEELKLLQGAIKSLKAGMKLINESIPKILKEVSVMKKLPSLSKKKSKETNLERVRFKRVGGEVLVTLNRKDRERFFRELDIGEQFVKKLRKKDVEEEEKIVEFQASRGYLKLANRMFLGIAQRYVRRGYFKSLAEGLKRANFNVLFESYVALLLLTLFFSVIASIFLMGILVIFETLPIWPFFELRTTGHFIRLLKISWLPLALPILTFFAVYYYPSTEKKSIGKKIDQELPFAVIHMSAIAGSGIAPSEIFRIIGMSKEYPLLRKEIRKVLNQINLYGYDLTTALNNASKSAPSEKLSELFSGLGTTISSGANLSNFFEKRAETLLLGYRLERQKYTKLVETFLDIYISIVIAAPMIFLLLLIMMAISGISVGLSPWQISLLAVFTISLLNLLFLVFLHIKQPSY